MPQAHDVREAGDRVETLPAESAALSDPATWAKAVEPLLKETLG